MTEPSSEHWACVQDAALISADRAQYGEPKDLRWVLSWQGRNVQCHYWSGALNESRVTLRLPLEGVGPDTVQGPGYDLRFASAELNWSESGLIHSNVWAKVSPALEPFAELRLDEGGGGPFARLRAEFATAVLASTLSKITAKE